MSPYKQTLLSKQGNFSFLSLNHCKKVKTKKQKNYYNDNNDYVLCLIFRLNLKKIKENRR